MKINSRIWFGPVNSNFHFDNWKLCKGPPYYHSYTVSVQSNLLFLSINKCTKKLWFYINKILHVINKVIQKRLRLSWSWSYSNWIYNYLCNQCLSPLTLWAWIPFRRRLLDTTLCNKYCQWLTAGQWFSPVSTNKTDSHNIIEILLKVALNTINQPSSWHAFSLIIGKWWLFVENPPYPVVLRRKLKYLI